MADQTTPDDKPKPDDKAVGKGECGADASGAGNILAGVQPEAGVSSDSDERGST